MNIYSAPYPSDKTFSSGLMSSISFISYKYSISFVVNIQSIDDLYPSTA